LCIALIILLVFTPRLYYAAYIMKPPDYDLAWDNTAFMLACGALIGLVEYWSKKRRPPIPLVDYSVDFFPSSVTVTFQWPAPSNTENNRQRIRTAVQAALTKRFAGAGSPTYEELETVIRAALSKEDEELKIPVLRFKITHFTPQTKNRSGIYG